VAWRGQRDRRYRRGVESTTQLEDFVRARVEEQVVTSRLAPAADARADAEAGPDRTQAVIDAVDQWELMAMADSAEHEGRPLLATDIRLRLARAYAAHGDFDPAWQDDAGTSPSDRVVARDAPTTQAPSTTTTRPTAWPEAR